MGAIDPKGAPLAAPQYPSVYGTHKYLVEGDVAVRSRGNIGPWSYRQHPGQASVIPQRDALNLDPGKLGFHLAHQVSNVERLAPGFGRVDKKRRIERPVELVLEHNDCAS